MDGFRRLLVGIGWALLTVFASAVAYVVLTPDPPPMGGAQPAAQPSRITPSSLVAPVTSAIHSVEAWADALSPDCAAPGFESAAQANGLTEATLVWAPFHRPETGWEIYAPRVSQEIGATCAPDTPAFASRLSLWQGAHHLKADGQMDTTTFGVMNNSWEMARPFVQISQKGICPDAPIESTLASAAPEEGYARKPIQLRPAALAAYRQMLQAARAASPAIAADPRLLSIFSGYRSPDSDAARCARDNDCENITRAACSAHRTGLAVDLYLGAAPGSAPELSDDTNRLYQSHTPAYAWMIANAGRFGFVNYPFEPWHWEWTGEAP